MRGMFRIAYAAMAISTGAACAASEEEPWTDRDDGGALPMDDAGAAGSAGDAGSADDVDAREGGDMCSPAGWCTTPLPDSDLTMKDVWPFPNRAFAVAESPTVGVKVLEWDATSDRWSYIDDSSQNQFGFGVYAGKMWVADEDEIYFTVGRPAYVYHGTRPVPPATAWSWTHHPLPDNSHNTISYWDNNRPLWHNRLAFTMVPYPALGVWGTSKDDVYAWASNTIFHWSNDGGAWEADYVLDDPDSADPEQHLFFLSASGANRDDIWFSGARQFYLGSCGIALRKTPAGYRRIADGVVDDPFRDVCKEKPERLMIDGWLTDVQSPIEKHAFGLNNARNMMRISVADDGTYSIATSAPSPAVASNSILSLWSMSESQHWLSGDGVVLRATNVWEDDSAFQISTIGLNGAPLRKPFYQVRGTSNTNLWAVGEGYALHKTTP